MDRPTLTTASEFLAALKASCILTSPAWDAANKAHENAISASSVAESLIVAGLMTRFQADRILQGKHQGLVHGQYIILEPHSKTANGRIYKAKHRSMDRLVAIHVLATTPTDNSQHRDDFLTRVRSAAQLAHHNIITVLDVNQRADRIFVVTEFLHGSGLDHLTARGVPFSVTQISEIIRQVAVGLQHAHDIKLYHGRLTPNAIMLGPTQGNPDKLEIKIRDFGFGHAEQNNLRDDICDYQAPELFDPNAEPTALSDLYSLGCIFYYLLTGQPPFPQGTTASKALLHQSVEPLAVEMLRPDTPYDLINLVHLLLKKNPEHRIASAGVLASQLDAFSVIDEASQIDFNILSQLTGSSISGKGYLTGISVTPIPHSGGLTRPRELVIESEEVSCPWQTLGDAQTDEVVAQSTSETSGSVIQTNLFHAPRKQRTWLIYVVAAFVMLMVLFAASGIIKMLAPR